MDLLRTATLFPDNHREWHIVHAAVQDKDVSVSCTLAPGRGGDRLRKQTELQQSQTNTRDYTFSTKKKKRGAHFCTPTNHSPHRPPLRRALGNRRTERHDFTCSRPSELNTTFASTLNRNRGARPVAESREAGVPSRSGTLPDLRAHEGLVGPPSTAHSITHAAGGILPAARPVRGLRGAATHGPGRLAVSRWILTINMDLDANAE